MPKDRDYDADFPAGSRVRDVVLSALVLVIIWPIAMTLRALKKKIWVCNRCGEIQYNSFQCGYCGWGDLYPPGKDK